MDKCLVPHEDYVNEVCPECQEKVDTYGNTEGQPFDFCTFPDCGCDGARLCMTGEPNADALGCNVEGMWTAKNKTRKQKKGILDLYGLVLNAEADDG